ncbi:unnamed protein product [Clonostachys rhizophaga]|uniref:Uncharacterized protein n=1 Tax=Clonostachys rhizophaga TaxID=160324 RepID=A0A9N9V378_9HYPO|nr:unnamed protein product [Clonostachys rhizophaga]
MRSDGYPDTIQYITDTIKVMLAIEEKSWTAKALFLVVLQIREKKRCLIAPQVSIAIYVAADVYPEKPKMW